MRSLASSDPWSNARFEQQQHPIESTLSTGKLMDAVIPFRIFRDRGFISSILFRLNRGCFSDPWGLTSHQLFPTICSNLSKNVVVHTKKLGVKVTNTDSYVTIKKGKNCSKELCVLCS